MPLITSTNTQKAERRVMKAATLLSRAGHRRLSVDYEHGQWWVTCEDCAAQWSAVDQHGGGDVDGIGFEQVSKPLNDGCAVSR